jgi:hypothetical protein
VTLREIFSRSDTPKGVKLTSTAILFSHSMSTCPRCKGPLTDGHRCPRRTSFVALEIVGSALAGGLGGLLLLAAFDPRGQVADMDTITFVVAAAVAVGINRLVRG